jgi:hypothetical protein
MALRDAEPLKDEPSTLERFFTFLGRPQYALSSALTGEGQDAAENVLRFGEELFTGSWLHGYKATNLLPGDWGSEDRSERPEGSDVARRFGYSVDRGSWSELGLNLGAGALLDPLTYVGGIGLGAKAGRLGAGELVGQVARQAALKRVGLADEFLLRAMNAADAQPVVTRVLAEETDRLLRAQEKGAGVLDDLLSGLAPDSLTPDAYRGLARRRAAERLGIYEPGTAAQRVVLTGNDAQSELLEAGIRELEGEGLIRPAGVPTLEIPGLTWHALPGGAEQWSKIGLATPAKALTGLIGLGSPALAEGLGRVGTAAVDGLRRTFVDRLSFGAIPVSVQAEAGLVGSKIMRDNADALKRISEVSAGLSPEADRAIGAEFLKADDLFRKGVTKEQAEEAARRLGIHPDTIRKVDMGDPSPQTKAVLEEVLGALPWLGKGDQADYVRLAYADTKLRVVQAAVAAGGDAATAARTLDAYVDDVRKIPQDLVDRGIWSKAEATPFYFPHQANEAMALFLASGSASKRAGKGSQTYAEALADAFTKGRENNNLAEILASFRKVAERYDVPIPDLTDFGAHASDLGGVLETSLTKLWGRRVWAHNGTIGRADFEKLARERVTDLRHATVLDQFLDASLRGIGARESVIGKLLGGGDLRFSGAVGEVAESAAPWLGGRAAAVGGQRGWVYKFPGINSFVKPALYLPAVATYTRNALGGVVMGAMDPEIGLGGASGLLSVLRDLPIVRALSGGPARDLQAAMVAVARGREPGVSLAGRTIGGYSAEEVVQQLRGSVLGQNAVGDKELFESVGSVREFVDEVKRTGEGGWEAFKADMRAAWTGKGITSQSTSARAVERYRRFWAPASRMNQAIEDGLRAGAYFKLIGAGYDPASAAKKVRETFVDYAYQSGEERLLRDLMPFVRFTLGAGPNAIAGSTGVVGRSVGRATVGTDDGRPIPPELARQISIPVPGMADTYATSLGLPFEAGGALLGSIPGATGWARNTEQNVLGGLTPQLKSVGELVTGKQFYSDLPLSEVRPVLNLPPYASHALFGFLPLSRFWGETKKLMDARENGTRGYVNFFTGVKLRTVDAEREAEQVIKRWLETAVKDGDAESIERFFVSKSRDPNDPKIKQVKAALEALAAKERARRAKG